MLQSIILQTIFLSFTLLGCSENRDVCGNENDGFEVNSGISTVADALGGRVADEIVYGEKEVTTGASNDLQQVGNGERGTSLSL